MDKPYVSKYSFCYISNSDIWNMATIIERYREEAEDKLKFLDNVLYISTSSRTIIE